MGCWLLRTRAWNVYGRRIYLMAGIPFQFRSTYNRYPVSGSRREAPREKKTPTRNAKLFQNRLAKSVPLPGARGEATTGGGHDRRAPRRGVPRSRTRDGIARRRVPCPVRSWLCSMQVQVGADHTEARTSGYPPVRSDTCRHTSPHGQLTKRHMCRDSSPVAGAVPGCGGDRTVSAVCRVRGPPYSSYRVDSVSCAPVVWPVAPAGGVPSRAASRAIRMAS